MTIERIAPRMDPIDTLTLRLEPLLPTHAAALLPGLSDPRIYAFLDERAPASVAALEERYQRLATRRSPDGLDLWLNWALFFPKAGCHVGYVQATVHPDGTAEIAYVLFPPWWGRGHAREAVLAMLAHLRERFGVTRFVARVHPENRRSIALVTALGFVRIGRAPGGGMTQVEDEVYSLRAEATGAGV
jgi:RimJ/RimL family protein N-acetyltransferase